ncbi:MAG TPA: aminotransferase class IV family protein [Roseiarcus sp.]|nr:aminotransferase class IV family protein [Roseiarcus sp.]
MPHQGEIPDGRDFELIETLRWTRSAGFTLLDEHVARLSRSSAALGFRCEEGDVRGALARVVDGRREETLRVRLTLGRDGGATVGAEPLSLPQPGARWRIAFASRRFDSRDPLLRHKTTRRGFLEEALAEAQRHVGAEEVLFLNERDELCEGARSNLFVAENGVLKTPPVACGLLPGTLREFLLREEGAREAVLRPPDLEGGAEIYMGNSVRGLVPAILVGEAAPLYQWERGVL